MVLTEDDKRLAYLFAKLPLKTKEIEDHIKELLRILHFEEKGYKSKLEDPEHKLWELSLLITHFEKMLSTLNSVKVRLYIKNLKASWATTINYLRKIGK